MEEELSKTLVYLWQAAEKFAGNYPVLAAHDMVKCRRLQGLTPEGLKANKFKTTSLCVGCGTPWALAKYRISVVKRSAAKHRKLKKKSIKCPEKLTRPERHLFALYQTQNSSLVLHCRVCEKKTFFSIPAPSPVPKPENPNSKKAPVKKEVTSSQKQRKRGVKDTNAGLVQLTKQQVDVKPTPPAAPRSKNAIQAQKNQLKALLNAKKTTKSGLQDFLASI